MAWFPELALKFQRFNCFPKMTFAFGTHDFLSKNSLLIPSKFEQAVSILKQLFGDNFDKL